MATEGKNTSVSRGRAGGAKRKLILCILVIAMLCVVGMGWSIYVARRFASAVERSTEMGFGRLGKPDMVGHGVLQHIDLPGAVPRGAFDIALGSVEEFELYDPGRLRGDLGEELLRFRGLRKITIDAFEQEEPTEEQWIKLCRKIREFPLLEELWISGRHLTDRALGELSDHPRIKVLACTQSALTQECVMTLASLHNLKTVWINGSGGADDPWEREQVLQLIRTKLPGIEVNGRRSE